MIRVQYTQIQFPHNTEQAPRPIRHVTIGSHHGLALTDAQTIRLNGSEPETLRLVAQCLNQLRHRVPHVLIYTKIMTILRERAEHTYRLRSVVLVHESREN
jgi:hypothetical protein